MAAAGLNDDITLFVDGKLVGSTLDARGQDTAISQGILDVGLERTIDGASTLTVTTKDPEKVLQHSGFFEKHSEAHLDGMAFIACAFSKKVDEYSLTFEDREFWMLSNDHKMRSAHIHGGYTLAMFVKKVCHEVCPHAPFICPELRVIQPIEFPKETAHATKPSPHHPQKGVTKGQVSIEGQPIDADQENNINITLQVCEELNAPTAARIGILCAGIVESGFKTHDPAHDGTGSDGVFQLTNATAASTHLSKFDTRATAKYWLQHGYYGKGGGIALAHQGLSPGDIAQNVEGSKFPERYEKHRHEAEDILNKGGGGSETAADKFFGGKTDHTTKEQKEKPFIATVNGGESGEENTLQGLQKYAEEGRWRLFMTKGRIYFIHDRYLAKLKPQLLLDEDTPGVLDIAWELDHKTEKKAPKITIEARAGLWTPETGETVRLKPSMGKEMSKGNWIVHTLERKDVTDAAVTITLSRPEEALAEKRERESITNKSVFTPGVVKTPTDPLGSKTTDGNGELREDSVLFNLLFNAKWIAKQHYKYVFGGGHRHDGTFGPSDANGNHGHKEKFPGEVISGNVAQEGLDCSGVLSWMLHSSGILALFVNFTGIFGNPGGGLQELKTRQQTEESLRSNAKQANLKESLSSGELARAWGQPGKGRWFTIWANDHHCFAEFNIPASMGSMNTDGKTVFFAAKQPGDHPEVGFAWSEPTAGFTSRHWPQI